MYFSQDNNTISLSYIVFLVVERSETKRENIKTRKKQRSKRENIIKHTNPLIYYVLV